LMEPVSAVFARVNRNNRAPAEHHRSWKCRQQVSQSSGTCWPCGGSLPSAQVSSNVLLLSVWHPGMQSWVGHAQLACATWSCPGLSSSIPTASGRIWLGAGVTHDLVVVPGNGKHPGCTAASLGECFCLS